MYNWFPTSSSELRAKLSPLSICIIESCVYIILYCCALKCCAIAHLLYNTAASIIICSMRTASDLRCTCSSVCSAAMRLASFRWRSSFACHRTDRGYRRRRRRRCHLRHRLHLRMAHSPHHNIFPTDSWLQRSAHIGKCR